jgi:hypothetical protein
MNREFLYYRFLFIIIFAGAAVYALETIHSSYKYSKIILTSMVVVLLRFWRQRGNGRIHVGGISVG